MDGRTFLHSGLGVLLRKAGELTANAPAGEDTTIETAGYSESVGGDCKELLFAFVFAAAATGNFVVQRSATPDFAVYETHATVAVTASRFYSWAAGETLLGYYRILNSTGQTAQIYVNKRIN